MKFAWAALILSTLYVCYFSRLGTLGFAGPDEPRYAWIARAMVETGDWVTPKLYAKPWFEKPPLFYWGAALSFKWFGVSEASARFPSAVSALLATLALAWLAARMYGAATARLVLLMLPTTAGMIGFSHAAATDMPFTAMLTIAMVAAAVVVGIDHPAQSLPPRAPTVSLVAFGAFLGAATLAKGPAAIVLAGGGAGLWALLTNRWRDAFRLAHPIAIVAFCIAALPWYVLCALRNPDFLRVFILEHNFARYLTREFRHVQPIWFFLPVLLLGMLIWTGTFVGVVKDATRAWREHRWRSSAGLFPLCWASFTFVFFSLSKSKLPGYILPAIPPLMLLAAYSVSRRLHGEAARGRWPAIMTGLTLIAMGGFSIGFMYKIPFAVDYLPPQPLGWVILSVLLGGLAAIILGVLRRATAALSVCVLCLIVAIPLSVAGDSGWALNAGISARQAGQSHSTANTSAYKVSRSFQYALNFYQHKEVPEWSVNAAQPGWVFTQAGKVDELRELGLKCPAYIAYPAVVVCQDPGLPDRLAGGRKIH
ncbi:MAG TPA: glycosyltransferase family 39 protein [Candidatus Acidoferrales bacterium]|nr:glycosyltransferase family 39 protein [Candidatus Acidoferrales bacterium]